MWSGKGKRKDKILIVGLGNREVIADALGPEVVEQILITRDIRGRLPKEWKAKLSEVSALAPGVMGQTGIETGEIIESLVKTVKPEAVIAVDALAAGEIGRLGRTVQICDSGIAPGSGVGNDRRPLNREVLGVPVIGVGVPTVVDSATLVWDALERAGMTEEGLTPVLTEVLTRGRSFIVAPKDSDEVVALSCRLLAMGLDRAFGVGEI